MMEIIDVNNTSDSNKVKILKFKIEELEKQVAELTSLVDKSEILHYKDNFRVVKKSKENEEVVHFSADGKQLPF